MKRTSKIDDVLEPGRRPTRARPTEVCDTVSAPAARSKPKAGHVDAFFDSSKGIFWSKNSRGEWIGMTESSLKRILRWEHFADVDGKEVQQAMIERKLIELQREQDVAFCQPIAGYAAGLQHICGQRVLVTSGPRPIKPKDGEWGRFRRLVNELLGEHVNIFHAWLQQSLRSYYAGPPFRPGQMLVLAGETGCGKSLLQNIITEIFGGRVAKPFRYMTDRTTFNSDLLGAEHLMIEDEAAGKDLRTRRHFGAQLKNMIAGEGQSLHRKGRDALMVTPFWRITLSVNNEPENLMVLPPLDESIEDKVTLLSCAKATFPYGTDDTKARVAWRTGVTAELPCYLRWLQQFKVPPVRVCQRYGVKAFHDPTLATAIRDLQPEMRLWSLIHGLQIWGVDNENFRGTADQLEEELLRKDRLNRVEKLLYFDTSCGVYLTRLAKLFPERVRRLNRGKDLREWEITHPDRSFIVE